MPSDALSELTLEHFRLHGWMRVARAFDQGAALRMRETVWRALADMGIHRDRPQSWTVERPAKLQHLKGDPVFRAVGSKPLLSAIDAILEGRRYEAPKDWGAFFIAFPSDAAWEIPTSGWHVDANYTSALWPAGGVKTFALLGDVVPLGGGTLLVSGSHRIVHDWFRNDQLPAGARSADMRKLLLAHPYVADLHRAGAHEERVARFLDRSEEINGVPLKVVETTGGAGDVILVHPLILHVAAPNNAAEPRFLLSGGITTDMWGWGG